MINFKKLFGLIESADSKKSPDPQKEKSDGIAVNKSSWYTTHNEAVSQEFQFLISEFDFKVIQNEFVSRELWIVYAKKNIKVEIWADYRDLPFVSIRNSDLIYDESKNLDNGHNIEEFNMIAKKINLDWNKRRRPIENKFLKELTTKNSMNSTELEKDYECFGKTEHIEYLKQAALTVRERLEAEKKGTQPPV